MINKIIVQGRLTSDPEMRTTTTGTELAKFTLAVDRPKQKDKEKVTDFIPCTVFGSLANMVGKWFSKGQMMVCSGKLTVDRYQGKDGQNRTYTYINVDEVSFGGDRQKAGQSSSTQYSSSQQQPPKPSANAGSIPLPAYADDDEDFLPF